MPEQDAPPEYNGERDMEKFWAANKVAKEPIRQKWFAPILLILIVFSVPWYRTGGEIGRIIGGLPTWVWTSLLCTVGVSVVTAVGALLFWKEEDGDE